MRRFIRQCLRRRGIELSRYSWPQLIATVAPDVVLDIGANVGQYAQELRAAGYRKRIVSFEPLSAAHAELVRRSAGDASWSIAPRMALGDREGEERIHIAGNSFSSSLLTMRELHRQAAPAAAYVDSETVHVRRLDAVAPEYVHSGERCLIKIDTQGYEQRVLAGGPQTLAGAAALQFEASLTPLYDGEATLQTLLDQVAATGLELWSLLPAFTDLRSGRLLQVDCFFTRPGMLA
ncbi:MAG TPA: FkbM family methyltransferase [Steroidobacteraceae bacterium]|nr:FkbM family methyltransferase [Steroidobacteraceae bacterium]